MAYATISEADAYVRSYYSSTDPIRVNWEALNNEDKQVQLNKAEQVIDQLPLQGKPINPPKAFPRHPFKDESVEKAKLASIELALQSQDKEGQDRVSLRRQGVKSYRIGDLSETFESSSALNGIDEFVYGVVFPFLRDWLGGGYRICPTHIRR